jgi:hypothetical protein
MMRQAKKKEKPAILFLPVGRIFFVVYTVRVVVKGKDVLTLVPL